MTLKSATVIENMRRAPEVSAQASADPEIDAWVDRLFRRIEKEQRPEEEVFDRTYGSYVSLTDWIGQ